VHVGFGGAFRSSGPGPPMGAYLFSFSKRNPVKNVKRLVLCGVPLLAGACGPSLSDIPTVIEEGVVVEMVVTDMGVQIDPSAESAFEALGTRAWSTPLRMVWKLPDGTVFHSIQAESLNDLQALAFGSTRADRDFVESVHERMARRYQSLSHEELDTEITMMKEKLAVMRAQLARGQAMSATKEDGS